MYITHYISVICSQQMPNFPARMHQIQFRLRLRPRPRFGRLQRSCQPRNWWGGGWLPSLQEPRHPALSPSGLSLQSFRPRSWLCGSENFFLKALKAGLTFLLAQYWSHFLHKGFNAYKRCCNILSTSDDNNQSTSLPAGPVAGGEGAGCQLMHTAAVCIHLCHLNTWQSIVWLVVSL